MTRFNIKASNLWLNQGKTISQNSSTWSVRPLIFRFTRPCPCEIIELKSSAIRGHRRNARGGAFHGLQPCLFTNQACQARLVPGGLWGKVMSNIYRENEVLKPSSLGVWLFSDKHIIMWENAPWVHSCCTFNPSGRKHHFPVPRFLAMEYVHSLDECLPYMRMFLYGYIELRQPLVKCSESGTWLANTWAYHMH